MQHECLNVGNIRQVGCVLLCRSSTAAILDIQESTVVKSSWDIYGVITANRINPHNYICTFSSEIQYTQIQAIAPMILLKLIPVCQLLKCQLSFQYIMRHDTNVIPKMLGKTHISSKTK